MSYAELVERPFELVNSVLRKIGALCAGLQSCAAHRSSSHYTYFALLHCYTLRRTGHTSGVVRVEQPAQVVSRHLRQNCVTSVRIGSQHKNCASTATASQPSLRACRRGGVY